MKYLFLMTAFVTMLANIFITVQAVQLKKRIKKAEGSDKSEMITFYLPPKTQRSRTSLSGDQCADTVLLDGDSDSAV